MNRSRTIVLEHAPNYCGVGNIESSTVGHLPICLDTNTQESFLFVERRNVLEPLLDVMNDFIDSLRVSLPLTEINLALNNRPQVYVGINNSALPFKDMGNDNINEHKNIIHIIGPSQVWSDKITTVMDYKKLDNLICLNLGFSQYWVCQKNLPGHKVLELGTGNVKEIPWLMDMDTPIEVFHITGALLSREGKVIKAGAEGIIYKRTGMLSSLFDLQETIRKSDIESLLTKDRYNDLPGAPLKWQVAIQNIVAQLLDRHDLLYMPMQNRADD